MLLNCSCRVGLVSVRSALRLPAPSCGWGNGSTATSNRLWWLPCAVCARRCEEPGPYDKDLNPKGAWKLACCFIAACPFLLLLCKALAWKGDHWRLRPAPLRRRLQEPQAGGLLAHDQVWVRAACALLHCC